MAASCHRSEFTQPRARLFDHRCAAISGENKWESAMSPLHWKKGNSLRGSIHVHTACPFTVYCHFWQNELTVLQILTSISIQDVLWRPKSPFIGGASTKKRKGTFFHTLSGSIRVLPAPYLCTLLPFMTKCVKCTANNCVPNLVHMTSFAALTLAWVKIFLMNDCHFSL